MQVDNQAPRGRWPARRWTRRGEVSTRCRRARSHPRSAVLGLTALALATLGLPSGAVASAGPSQPFTAPQAHGHLPVGTAVPPGPNVIRGLEPAIEGPGPNLYSVAAIAADDAWTVGLAHGLVLSEHWDGNSWSLGHTGMPGGSLSSEFYGVSADSSDDVWAVGAFSSQATKRGSLVAHFDGKNWTLMHTADPVSGLYGVDVLASSDVWAVGNYLDDSATIHPVIEHWDGAAWSTVDSPDVAGGSLGSVTAVSSTDIWAAGSYSDASGTTLPLIEHWDGSSWSLSKPVVPRSAVFTSLLGISAVSANDAWAVGAYLDSNFVLKTLSEHWNGKRWTLVRSPNVKDAWTEFTAVTAIASTDVWAVGNVLPNAGGGATYTAHWDGSSWRHVHSPGVKDRIPILVAVSAVGAGDIWAVGYAVSATDPNDVVNLIEHWNGSHWERVKSPNP